MIAVIGDIHGCFNTLTALYKKIKSAVNNCDIYSVGDIIDRGNFSLEAFDFILENDIKFVKGNHEMMFYSAFRSPDNEFALAWDYNGNEATMKAYLSNKESLETHLNAVGNAPFFFNIEEAFISHAGISKDLYKDCLADSKFDFECLKKRVKNDSFEQNGILWNRERLMDIKKTQIIGHTRTGEVYCDNQANAYYIDTGAYSGNKLSAVFFEGGKLADVLEEETHFEDIE